MVGGPNPSPRTKIKKSRLLEIFCVLCEAELCFYNLTKISQPVYNLKMLLYLSSNLKTVFAIISALISIGVFINYVRSTLKKETRPHTYTWLIWALTQGTAVAGIWYGRGGLGAIALTLSTVFVFSVFLLSLKYGTRNITFSDTVILIFALVAIVVWWQLNSPVLAIIMVSVIDFIGYIPSWRKSTKDPWSETLLSWSISPIGHFFAILAFTEYNFFTLTYPLSLMTANFILVAICLIYRRKIPKK